MMGIIFVVIPVQAGIQHTRPFALDSGSALRCARNDRREIILDKEPTACKVRVGG